MSRKIIGITVGTQLPKPNFKQTDPTKGDYIKNKPDFAGLENKVDTIGVLVGDKSVSEQINTAISNIDFPDEIYVQDNEPADVEDGTLWLDTDEEAVVSGGGVAGGGSASIDVTASVGQTIVVEEVDANGKPTKWKAADYQPRTHWSEFLSTVLIDNQSFAEYSEEAFEFLLVAGQSYHIVFNGAEYDEVARSFDVGGMQVILLGNGVTVGEEDNGIPYAFQSMDGFGTLPMSVDSSAFTLTLSTVQETVNKLPMKYIPDEVAAYAPVYVSCMQGETVNQQIPVIFTTQLEALIDAGRTVIMKASLNFGILYFHLFGEFPEADGRRSFSFAGGNYTLYLTPQDDGMYIGEIDTIGT